VDIAGLRAIAKQRGLDLTDEELEKLRAGVQRNLEHAARVRAVIQPVTEPAPVFDAATGA
jgi:hypothetical protein